jgi:hypothetical protein
MRFSILLFLFSFFLIILFYGRPVSDIVSAIAGVLTCGEV